MAARKIPSRPAAASKKKMAPSKRTSSRVAKPSKSRAKPAATRGAPNPWAPKYTWAPWGTSGVVHDNCYDYAFGSFSNNRTKKSVMGDRSKNLAHNLSFRTCDGIAKRVLEDNPGAVYKMKTGGEKPKPGYYKVMCFVAPTNDFGNSTGDFHWYKEISAIRYRTRPGDTAEALAKFFHVTKATIMTALGKAKASANKNNGRVANTNKDLHVLNRMASTSKGTPLPVGRVLDFPVKLWSHKLSLIHI